VAKQKQKETRKEIIENCKIGPSWNEFTKATGIDLTGRKKVEPGKWQQALRFCRDAVQQPTTNSEVSSVLTSSPLDYLPDDDEEVLDYSEITSDANDDDELQIVMTEASHKRPLELDDEPAPKRHKTSHTSQRPSRTNSDLTEAFSNLQKENLELREKLLHAEGRLFFLENAVFEQRTTTTTTTTTQPSPALPLPSMSAQAPSPPRFPPSFHGFYKRGFISEILN